MKSTVEMWNYLRSRDILCGTPFKLLIRDFSELQK